MITSTSNQKVKQVIQWQTKAKERKSDRVFLAEGFKMFEEAPKDWVKEVYLSQNSIDKAKENTYIWEKLSVTGFETVSSEVFRKMSDTQSPQGILTILKQPGYQMDELLKQKDSLFVLLEDLQDPGNLGTIVRTAEGAGVTGIVMSSNTVDIFNPKVIRATMGSIYRVPFVYVEDMKEILQKMQIAGVHTYAAHLDGMTYYDSFSFKKSTAFLIGNEGNGLKRETAQLADSYLKIPMEGRLESLNAAVATALLVYEAHRQRQ